MGCLASALALARRAAEPALAPAVVMAVVMAVAMAVAVAAEMVALAVAPAVAMAMALVLAVVMAVEMVAPGPDPRRFPFCIGTCRSSWGRRATTGTRPRTWRSGGLSPRGSALLPPRRRMSHSRRCTEDRALFRQPPPSGPARGPRALGLRVGTTGGPPGTGRLRRPCPSVSHRRRPRHPLKGPRLSR